MAKYFLATIVLLFGLMLVAPTLVSAAWNDVQFTEDTNIDLEGIPLTLVISAGSKVASMTVYPTYISFNFENGSTIRITSADRKELIANPPVASTTCEAASSWLSHSSTITQTVTITPGNTCTTPAAVTGTSGVSGGGGGAPAAATPAPTPIVTAIVTATVSATTGGETPTATTATGCTAKATIPAEAVTAATNVSIAPTATTATAVAPAVAAVPTGESLVGGYVYDYAATSAGAAVTTFAKPVTLTFTYTDAQVSGLNESTLTVSYWDSAASQWVTLPTTVNTATNTLIATTTHLTYFAILGKTAITAEQLKASMIDLIKQIIALITQLITELQTQLTAMQT